jgi:hypothetical protein
MEDEQFLNACEALVREAGHIWETYGNKMTTYDR